MTKLRRNSVVKFRANSILGCRIGTLKAKTEKREAEQARAFALPVCLVGDGCPKAVAASQGQLAAITPLTSPKGCRVGPTRLVFLGSLPRVGKLARLTLGFRKFGKPHRKLPFRNRALQPSPHLAAWRYCREALGPRLLAKFRAILCTFAD